MLNKRNVPMKDLPNLLCQQYFVRVRAEFIKLTNGTNSALPDQQDGSDSMTLRRDVTTYISNENSGLV